MAQPIHEHSIATVQARIFKVPVVGGSWVPDSGASKVDLYFNPQTKAYRIISQDSKTGEFGLNSPIIGSMKYHMVQPNFHNWVDPFSKIGLGLGVAVGDRDSLTIFGNIVQGAIKELAKTVDPGPAMVQRTGSIPPPRKDSTPPQTKATSPSPTPTPPRRDSAAVPLQPSSSKQPKIVIDLAQADQYKLQSRLGSGGFGTVWKAIDPKTNTEVAIKIHSDYAPNTETSPTKFFLTELKTHKSITSSPSAPRVPKFIAEDLELGLFVMEFVPGDTADKYFRQGSGNVMSGPNAIRFLRFTLETLTVIHNKGVYHRYIGSILRAGPNPHRTDPQAFRDLKPNNIMMHKDTGEPWIFDFGIAKEVNPLAGHLQQITDVGTLAFRAPEYIYNLGKYNDIYSLGATVIALTNLVTSDDIKWSDVAIRCPFPNPFKDLLQKMVELDYTKRYQSCEEVLKGLNALL